MKKVLFFLVFVLAFAAGATLRLLSSEIVNTQGDGRDAVRRDVTCLERDAQSATTVEIAELRKRQDELEVQIAEVEKFEEPVRKTANSANDLYYGGEGSVAPENNYRTVGDVKKLMPEGYAMAFRIFTSAKKRGRRWLDDYKSYVGGLDLSGIPDDEKAVHERFLNAVVAREAALAKFRIEDDNFTEEETAQIHEEIEVRAEDAADDLMAETSMLMGLSVEKCARERGFSEENAAAIADTYRAIYEATAVVF